MSAPGSRPFLHVVRRDVSQITDALANKMFDLFSRHYDAVTRERFGQDLAEKETALLLFDGDGAIAGFTLLKQIQVDRPFACTCIYSGDTVVAPGFWGRNNLIMAFLSECGRIGSTDPDRELYWFVLIKGARTWRILSSCFRAFHPSLHAGSASTCPSLAHALGEQTFGNAYDPDTGTIWMGQSFGHLKPALAEIPPRHRDRPDIRLFLERNPGFAQGRELLCLARLAPDNLRSSARRAFLRGFDVGVQARS
jgi:hypothetical protein